MCPALEQQMLSDLVSSSPDGVPDPSREMDTKRSPQTPDYKVINALMGAVKHPLGAEVFGNLRKEGMLVMALEVLR